MDRLRRIVIGRRTDVDLGARWWHRLFVVVGLLAGTLLLVGLTFATHTKPEATIQNVTIRQNIKDFTRANPQILYAAAAFYSSADEIGILSTDGRALTPTPAYLPMSAFCNADMKSNVLEMHKAVNGLSYTDAELSLSDARAFADLLAEDGNVCIFENLREWPEEAKIVAYDFTPRAQVMAWLEAFFFALAVVSGLYFVLGNLYYRGLIYIVFGKRRSPVLNTTQPTD